MSGCSLGDTTLLQLHTAVQWGVYSFCKYRGGQSVELMQLEKAVADAAPALCRIVFLQRNKKASDR